MVVSSSYSSSSFESSGFLSESSSNEKRNESVQNLHEVAFLYFSLLFSFCYVFLTLLCLSSFLLFFGRETPKADAPTEKGS